MSLVEIILEYNYIIILSYGVKYYNYYWDIYCKIPTQILEMINLFKTDISGNYCFYAF